MTKTDFKASVSSATAAAPSAPSAPSDPVKSNDEITNKSQAVSSDSYSSTGGDSFKALMGGVKAATCGSGYALLLKEMMAGFDEPSGPSADDFEEVEIPAANELLSVPGIAQDVDATGAIVERYEGLEDLIEGLISQTDARLTDKDTPARMSTAEIMALRDYREELEGKMLYCHKQLELARFDHEWAKKDAAAAKEAALEEKEWWNQD